MDGKVSNFLLCLRDKHVFSWKLSWIAISTSLWTHPWQHFILNTVSTQRALLDTSLSSKVLVSDIWRWSHYVHCLSSPTNLYYNNFELVFLPQALLCPEFIFGVFLSVQWNGNNTKLWVIEQSLSDEFWELSPSESFVWLLLAMLVLTDHLSSFCKCHCYSLSVPSHLSHTSRSLWEPLHHPFQSLLPTHMSQHTEKSVANWLCHIVIMLICAHLSYLLHLLNIFLGWNLLGPE